MTRYRVHNNNLTPATPYLFAYDAGGSQSFNTAFLTWDTVVVKSSHFQYSADDDKIQLQTNSSGLYKVNFETSLTGSGGEGAVCLYKNSSEVSGSTSWVYAGNIGQTTYKNIIVLDYTIYLEKGDYIQIYATTPAGNSPSTIANSSRLKIEFLPMQGWNNSSGGRTEYKGGVLR